MTAIERSESYAQLEKSTSMSLSKCPAPCIQQDGMSVAMFQVNSNLATGQLDVPILLVFDVQSWRDPDIESRVQN